MSGLLNHEDGKVTDGSIEFEGERIDRLHAEKIAKKFNGKAVEWDNLTGVINQANVIITATSSEKYVLDYPIL